MDQEDQRRSQSIGNILQVTKNIIKENDNFYDYFVNKDNSLYHKQLPLLVRRTKLQALVLYNKENKKQQDIYPVATTRSSDDQSLTLLDNIRNAQIRSKKLPPLCPFYNDKGELVPSVVKTSRVYNRYNFDNNETMNSIIMGGKRTKKILKKILKKNDFIENGFIDDFEKIEKDYFNFGDAGYDNLKYDENIIFGKKQFYKDLINKKIEEFKNEEITGDNIKESKKEKLFEKSRKKKKIFLSFDSICVQIFPHENVNSNESNKTNQVPIFEYFLPFYFLPLFYYKGEEKFKIFLSKVIEWDNVNKKFILNENQEKIYQDILKNCSDFNANAKPEEKKFNKLKSDDQIKLGKTKLNPSTGSKPLKLKKDTVIIRQVPTNNSTKEDHAYAQTMAGQMPNTYLTNLDGDGNKFNVTDKKSIYPSAKENNYIYYNVFEFLWLTPNNTFNVTIKMPLITLQIPKNNIVVRKYIDFELLFFLYQNNFNFWDFYIIKYLTSFKSFRALLEDINSLNEISNKKFFLTYPKIKTYSFNNFKFVNIVSIRQKDILDNLIDGLMNGSEDKKNLNQSKNDINKENNNNSDKNNPNVEPKEEVVQISKDEEQLQNSTFILKSFIAIIRFVDNKTLKAKEFKIYFNFAHFQKFQKLERFIDKISFLIKYIDIKYFNQTINIDYKSLDNFDEDEWIKDFEKYNSQYLHTVNNVSNNNPLKEQQKIFSEFSGFTKNTSIQIEIFRPLSLVRTLNENGAIKTEKNILGNNYMEKTISVEKDNIKEMCRIFYENYGNDGKNNDGYK